MSGFRWGAHIGSGGFGSVDEAWEIDEAGRVVRDGLARKKLLDRWLGDGEAVARFKREVRMLGEMDHPNIITVVGRNLSALPPWFVTVRADSNLDQEVHVNGRAGDRAWVIRVFRDILRGMAYAHTSRRVVHRDLKPENVLIVGDVPVISDFGLGKRLDTNTVDVTRSNIGMGTLRYMAPEQFVDAAHVSYPADVYALGKILREMLSGDRPPIGAMRVDDLPTEFQSFIARCVADDETDRYANASDALAAFDLLVGTGSGASPTSPEGGLEALLRRWEGTPETEDEQEVREIVAHLVAHVDDEALFFQTIPRPPRLLITQMIQRDPASFDRILTSYDAHTQGALPFEYCDVLANFYRDVLQADDDQRHRALIWRRLIELGPTHNRWHVGDIVGDILGDGAEVAVAEVAAEFIRADPVHANWYRPYIRNRVLPQAVRKAFDDIDPSPLADPDMSF